MDTLSMQGNYILPSKYMFKIQPTVAEKNKEHRKELL